jgi:hypothetical protein
MLSSSNCLVDCTFERRSNESAVQPEDADIAGPSPACKPHKHSGSSNPCNLAASRVASRRVVRTSARPHALMSTRQKSFFDQDPKAKVR